MLVLKPHIWMKFDNNLLKLKKVRWRLKNIFCYRKNYKWVENFYVKFYVSLNSKMADIK